MSPCNAAFLFGLLAGVVAGIALVVFAMAGAEMDKCRDLLRKIKEEEK